MRLVTYDAGSGPARRRRSTATPSSTPASTATCSPSSRPARRAGDAEPVESARLLAPLRPRTMRDFLTFEGHLKNALAGLGRDIPDEWYEIPAYYKGMPDTVDRPGRRDPLAGLHRPARPRARARRVIGAPGRDIAREDAPPRLRLDDLERHVGPRRPDRASAARHGPGKAKDWDGSNVLGPCIVTADELDASDAAMRVRVNGEVWGEDRAAHMHHPLRAT